MPTYLYPSSAELKEIEQDLLPNLTMNDPIFSILPIEEVDDTLLLWEIEDNYKGLQQGRGMNGRPSLVAMVGGKRLQVRPGVYGEYIQLDEEDLLRRRMFGTFAEGINIEPLVMKAQTQLLSRRIARLSHIGWTLLGTGAYSVAAPNGVEVAGDSFTFQTFTASIAWATSATATPLANFRAVKLLQRGHSVSFGAQAKAFMNQVTFNRMIANTNQDDLAGKRTSGLGTVLGLSDINTVLLQEDLPQIQIFEGGYVDEDGDFQLYLADGEVIVVGKRTSGAAIGNYRMTLNINNEPVAAGPYTKVIVGEDVPKSVQVHDGHNGGPVIYHPTAIVRMSV